jgi:hypothetical protein
MNSVSSRHSPVADSCERSNESSNSIKDREFLDQLGDYQLLKQESAQMK